MCGIVGYCGPNSGSNLMHVKRAVNALGRRGPDDSGVYLDEGGYCILGHARLSVVDLSSNASQPLTSRDDTVVISYNGEIYNHHRIRKLYPDKLWKSSSDTEVIIEHYLAKGDAFVDDIRGQYAIAIYDRNHGRPRLSLWRDRSGQKPLYYYVSTDGLYFASEIKALLPFGVIDREVDVSALEEYLTFGYAVNPQTLLSGVKELLPGHRMIYDIVRQKSDIQPYWAIPEPKYNANVAGCKISAVLSSVDDLLISSVEEQIVADVPVGLLLSGGVDSSLIASISSHINPNIRAYTVSFPGQGKSDEVKYASEMAEWCGIKHRVVNSTGVTVEDIRDIMSYMDDPFVDSSVIPTYLVSKEIRKHCTVALGGDGADELFGGYPHLVRSQWIDAFRSRTPWLPIRSIARVGASILPVGVRGRSWINALDYDMDTELPQYSRYLNTADIEKYTVLKPSLSATRRVRRHEYDTLYDLLVCDYQYYLAKDILKKTDRMSMANSLEIRAPFLDERLVQYCFSELPSTLKVTPDKRRKYILRLLCAKYLPKHYDSGRKQGFSISLSHLFSNPDIKEYVTQPFINPKVFRRKELDALLTRAQNSNSKMLWEVVWMAAVLERWLDRYEVDSLC